jgi:tetratricopeptide (TPR) repeat protein
MLLKKHIQINAFLIIIVFGLFLFPIYVMGNDNGTRLFKLKKYEEALPLFQEDFKKNPTDPTVCYYFGICLVETNHYGNTARFCLENALEKNQPYLANYYLAKNEHGNNKFRLAITYYSTFRKNASRKEIKDYNIDGLIDLCSRFINPFPIVQPLPDFSDKTFNETIENSKVSDSISMVSDSLSLTSESEKVDGKPLEIPTGLDEATINFILTSEIFYTRLFQFRTYSGKENFINGWNSSDSLNKLAFETDSLRKEYSNSISSEIKTQISDRVVDLESRILKAKLQSDEYYVKSGEQELSYWKQAPEEEKWKLKAENDSIKSEAVKKTLALSLKEKFEEIAPDTITTDTTSVDSTNIQTVIPANKPVNNVVIVFKVQIGAYNTELPESAKKLYKKISMLRKIDQFTDERKYTIYTIGELTNVKDAIKLQEQIRQESVKDAFVIAIKDGKRISLNEALEFTK